MGGKFHLKLHIRSKPIANKYHEGKMKRTLKRELKVPEIAEREANGPSLSRQVFRRPGWWLGGSAQAFHWVLNLTPVCHLPCMSTSVRGWGKLLAGGSLAAALWDSVGLDSSLNRSLRVRDSCSSADSLFRPLFSRGMLLGVEGDAFSLKDDDEMVSSDPSWNTDQGV